ncbi:hypothetical protein H9P43_007147 [Blastocladiella emersonii ATCC 22665]|nr:hypothetical protein H9P43_007147 [Blastocladiella emersonii ATCC 22665]
MNHLKSLLPRGLAFTRLTAAASPSRPPLLMRSMAQLAATAPKRDPTTPPVLIPTDSSALPPSFPHAAAFRTYASAALVASATPQSHRFDTYRMVTYLESRGFTRGQAVIVMRTMNELLADAVHRAYGEMVSRTDVENETYLTKAALAELGTELKMLRQNDHAALQSEIDAIARDLEVLQQRGRDDIATIKSDITIDLNNRKSEIREEGKVMDMRIQEVNNKLTVLCSDIKTEIESMKFDATKDVMVRLFFGALVLLVAITGLNTFSKNGNGSNGNSGSSKPKSSLGNNGNGGNGNNGSPTSAETVIIMDAGSHKKFNLL